MTHTVVLLICFIKIKHESFRNVAPIILFRVALVKRIYILIVNRFSFSRRLHDYCILYFWQIKFIGSKEVYWFLWKLAVIFYIDEEKGRTWCSLLCVHTWMLMTNCRSISLGYCNFQWVLSDYDGNVWTILWSNSLYDKPFMKMFVLWKGGNFAGSGEVRSGRECPVGIILGYYAWK